MQKKDCFLFGTVFKMHSYKGSVNIYNENGINLDFSKIKYFLIDFDNELVPYFIEKAHETKINVILVKFENLNSEETAKKIYKRSVYLPKDHLPKPNKDKITNKQLLGYKIVDEKLGELGEISHINSQTNQNLIYVIKGDTDFCFPMHKEFIKELNIKEKIMKVVIPKELLNLN